MTDIITAAKFWGFLVYSCKPTAIAGSLTWLSGFAIVFRLCPEATELNGASQMTQPPLSGRGCKEREEENESAWASIARTASRHSGSMVLVMRVLQQSGDQTLCLFHCSRCHRRDSWTVKRHGPTFFSCAMIQMLKEELGSQPCLITVRLHECCLQACEK